MSSRLRGLVLVLAVTLAGTVLPTALDTGNVAPRTTAEQAHTVAATSGAPLGGLTIALDPGHQLGNHNFPQYINKLVPAGGFEKPCNTTGTATNSGTAEATVNFLVSRLVQRRLENLGAKVRLTRLYNSEKYWGPCVNVRGAFGRRVGARLEVSLHADGASSSSKGFHVIAPARKSPYTTDIYSASLRLARTLRDSLTSAGLPRSNYIGGGTGLDVRSDLGTLNMSDVPIAMIEIGNMRNAGDAHRMLSPTGRATYADAVVRGIRSYLGR